jgi:2-polyprenyl-3-methyl-5-hydroxy-6-metoxy-1,4-benzoquinol methylase
MDKFWSAAEKAVSGLHGVHAVYGPEGMQIAGIKSYLDINIPLESNAAFVLHKGQLSQCDLSVLKAIEQQSKPIFANEVFVVFVGPDVIASSQVETDSIHLKTFVKLVDESDGRNQKWSLSKNASQDDKLKKLIISSVENLVEHTKPDGQPNINALWLQLKELNAIKWSVKQQGYLIGRAVYEGLCRKEVPTSVAKKTLTSKPSTQADLETDWFVYWMAQLMSAPLPHRKLWEFAWILQNLHAHGMLEEGKRALGFGCGEEPLPSFFASKGVAVTVTDLAPDVVAGMGWAETGQHTGTLDAVWKENLVSKGKFDGLVSLEYVDMNAIPKKLFDQYDFCWSVCALEHLGSIEKGLNFIENSLNTLKPGGIALHTTEFNYTETDLTIDNHPTVLFLRQHFIELARRLEAKGHIVTPLDFDVGNDPLDNFIDLPPFDFGEFLEYKPINENTTYRRGHLKLSVDGFPATCFGFKVQRRPN